MEQHLLSQSAIYRANKDSKKWLLDHIFSWFLAFVLPGVGTIVAALLLPPTANIKMSALYGFIGGLFGLTLLLAINYLIHLILAPYRQRNEARVLLKAKPKPFILANREALLRTIAEARMATIGLVQHFEMLNRLGRENPNRIDIKAIGEMEKTQQRFNQACESFEKEILVAGSDYEPILKPLYLFMQTSAILNASPGNVSNRNTIMVYKSKLEELVNETRNKIDESS